MRFRSVTGVVLALLLSTVPTAARQESGTNADEAAIRSLIENVEAANNAGDIERWVDYFADGAVYMPPGTPAVTTREGLVRVAEAGFRNEASIRIQPVEIRVLGDWAFARSNVSGTVKVHDSGRIVVVDTKQLAIYTRGEDGAWRIARLIMNGNAE